MAERDFKGVWIPKVIWLDKRLNALDKVILTEIDSLDSSERGCFASNKHIAEFCQCSETKVSKAVSKLIDLDYLYVQSFDGRQRELKSKLSQGRLVKNTRQDNKKCKAESYNLQESNIVSNTDNNTNKKKERKSGSYDTILSNVKDDGLRDLYYEFIKMRNLMKKPMTDRALEMLIKRVETLETSVENQKKILECSIMNNWQSVYPLKNEDRIRKPVSEPLRTAEPVKKEITEQDVERFKEMLKKDYPGLSDQWEEWIEAYRKGEWEE